MYSNLILDGLHVLHFIIFVCAIYMLSRTMILQFTVYHNSFLLVLEYRVDDCSCLVVEENKHQL
jgi:hypothetical protein